MKTALTIAGSDSSGGAGIQADIKTMTANGVYAMSAVTALTAQNTTGVTKIMEVMPEFLEEEIADVVTDIFPDAVKTGMVSSSPLIETISSCHERSKTYFRRCHGLPKKESSSSCRFNHSEYSGSSGSCGNEYKKSAGYGKGCGIYLR